MRRFVLVLLAVLTGLTVIVLAIIFATAAPTNEGVAQRFSPKKAVYEQLRDMLIEDSSVEKIAPWGVQTTTGLGAQMPPISELSLNRYQKYWALLSEIEAIGMLRSDEADPEVCILVWASGFAGNTVHVSVCWLGRDTPALRSTASRIFSRTPLDGQWFIVRDDQ